jgi:four helix bundle protein
MAYQSFEDLEVWQRACRLAVRIFETFLECKNFTMRDQIQRCALSIPSNISEGAERGTIPEFRKFLSYSKGSSGELRTQLYISKKLNLITTPQCNSLVAETREISAMLEGLRKSLARKSPKPLKT